MDLRSKLLDWLLPKPNPTPWIVFRRDGGWHIDWDHPEWKELIRKHLDAAMKLQRRITSVSAAGDE